MWRWGPYTVAVVWNWPVMALTYGRWVYAPGDDDRAWFARARVGPVKIEVSKSR